MLKMLSVFLILPFLFLVLFIISPFLKNSQHVSKIAKTVFLIELILAFFNVFSNEINFAFMNIDFVLDKFSSYLLFINALIFFLFSIFSKTFIIKFHKAFYSFSFLLFGIVNFLLLSDNIFASLILLFWLFLVSCFFLTTFSKNENKKNIIIQLMSDMFWYLVALFLILKEFARYFVVSGINFSFLELSQNLYKIDDFSIMLAFIGFLILLGRLFNFIPFCTKNLSASLVVNPLVYYMQGFSFLIVGCFLFTKIYLNFNFLFYQTQDIIALFLLFNFILFLFLSFRQNNMFKFLNNFFTANIIIGLFSVFSFEKECFRTFAYFVFVLIISYVFSSLVLIVLNQKFQTDKFDELKRINDKSRLFQFFIATSMLNIALAPTLAFFSAELICFMMIFSTDYEGSILNFVPIILIIGAFILALSAYEVIYKILIEPPEKSIKLTALSNHQILIFVILTFALIILSFVPDYIFRQIGTVVNIGNF